MADEPGGGDVGKVIAPAIASLIGAALTGWFGIKISPTIAVLTGLAGAVVGLALALIYSRYVAILSAGGDAKEWRERGTYNALRASDARQLYVSVNGCALFVGLICRPDRRRTIGPLSGLPRWDMLRLLGQAAEGDRR